MLNQILTLMSQFVGVGGGFWLIWGVIGLATGLRDQSGPDIKTGIWQTIGGAMIIAAAVLFKNIVVP